MIPLADPIKFAAEFRASCYSLDGDKSVGVGALTKHRLGCGELLERTIAVVAP